MLDQVDRRAQPAEHDARSAVLRHLLAGVADASNRRRPITRLTVARWLYTDRYFDPAHRLAKTIANEYEHLADRADDNEVLYRKAGKYSRIETYWKD